MRRCCTCKRDKPLTEFTRDSGGKRCRTCTREAMRRYRARKRDKALALRSAYRLEAPKDFPQFYEVMDENLRLLVAAVERWGLHKGTQNVIVPVDRFPQTGIYVDDRLRLETAPGTDPSWVINLDGVRGRIRLSDKPLHLFAAWLTERYAVLGEPKLGGVCKP